MYRGENNRTRSPLLCEVLEAREKLNIVLSSWETFEDLRKCWPSLHESKLRLNTCVDVVHVGQAQVRKAD